MPIDVDAMRVFVKVAELRSFTEAARQLAMPRARASAHVLRLEGLLGASVFQRSTRVVRLTPEGDQLLVRARAFLVDADEIESLFLSDGELRGRVRVGVPAMVARDIVVPRLPELLRRHPGLHVDLRASDRVEGALRAGHDIVLRVGPVTESGLVGRRVGRAPTRNLASEAYVRERGIPRSLADLERHLLVHYAADPTPTFEYFDGQAYQELAMCAVVTVDSFEAYEAAGRAGLGIVQLPHLDGDPLRGGWVEILPDYRARPSPLTVLHAHGRSVPRRVRVVLDWLVGLLQFPQDRTA